MLGVALAGAPIAGLGRDGPDVLLEGDMPASGIAALILALEKAVAGAALGVAASAGLLRLGKPLEGDAPASMSLAGAAALAKILRGDAAALAAVAGQAQLGKALGGALTATALSDGRLWVLPKPSPGSTIRRAVAGGRWPDKLAGERLDYAIDWSAVLAEGDPDDAPAELVSLVASPAGLLVEEYALQGSITVAWISGGAPATDYEVEATLRTQQERVIQARARIYVLGGSA